MYFCSIFLYAKLNKRNDIKQLFILNKIYRILGTLLLLFVIKFENLNLLFRKGVLNINIKVLLKKRSSKYSYNNKIIIGSLRNLFGLIIKKNYVQ